MPELPDILVYLDALSERLVGEELIAVQIRSPSVLHSWDPPLDTCFGKRVVGFRRIGKRIVMDLEGGLALVVHLMVGGRFHWKRAGVKAAGRNDLAAFQFTKGTVMFTEAANKKRATLHLCWGAEAALRFSRGGIDALAASREDFETVLLRENHTVKRTLTDPRLFDGIGNAYSDEILHAARLSPFVWTTRLSEDEVTRLWRATQAVLARWTALLRSQRPVGVFPEKVTAFHPEMAVHGKYGVPCPVCGTPVQRITYADNEANYCPTCQTGGKLLADRALSRLLGVDWPRTLDELEALKDRHRM